MFPGQLPSEQPLASIDWCAVSSALKDAEARASHAEATCMTAVQERERRTTAVQREHCLPRRRGQPCEASIAIIVCVRLHDRFHQESSAGKASHLSTRKQQKIIQNGLSNRQDPIHLRAAPRSGAALTLSTRYVDTVSTNTYDIV